MNLLYELPRLQFYLNRDGLEAAIAAAKQMVMVYRGAVLSMKKKHGKSSSFTKVVNGEPLVIACYPKNFSYRRSYLESALSARYILRERILEKYNA